MDILTSIYLHAVVLSALSVVLLHQILKSIPSYFTNLANKYPVPALIVLSVGTSAFVVWRGVITAPKAWTDWVILVATVAVTAAITYITTVKNWQQVRALEKTTSTPAV